MIIGETLIVASGLLMGYILPEILHHYGLDKEISYSYITPVLMALIPFIAYITSPVWVYWELAISPAGEFTGSVFMWLAITLLIGGYIKVIEHYLRNR